MHSQPRSFANLASAIESVLERLEPRQFLSTTPYRVASPVHLGTSVTAAAVADFNGDKIPDIAVGPSRNAAIDVVLNKGNATTKKIIPLTAGAGPFDIHSVDVNGDGLPDIITANANGASASVIINKGKGAFAPAANYKLAQASTSGPFEIGAADFNGDGRLDLAVTDSSNHGVQILLNKGKGRFNNAALVLAQDVNFTPVNPETLRIADINHDKHPDIIFSETNINRVGFLIGDGKGHFTAQTGPTVGSEPFDISMADLDGDGRPDLTTANHGDNTITIRPGLGHAKFGSPVTIHTDAGPSDLLATDLNKDGKMDLAVSSRDNSTVRVYYGRGSDTFRSAQSFNLTGGATLLTAADLNGDGKLDIILGGTSDTTGGDMTLLLAN